MDPKEIIAYLRQDPMDGELNCAIHGPLNALRMLPQVFRDGAEAAENDPEDDADNWEFLAVRLEALLEDFDGAPGETVETVVLDFDMTEDLQYLLAVSQARPELEIAVTGVFVGGTEEKTVYAAWHSPSGSNTLTPVRTKTPNDLESFLIQEVGAADADAWGFPAEVQEWFPAAEGE